MIVDGMLEISFRIQIMHKIHDIRNFKLTMIVIIDFIIGF